MDNIESVYIHIPFCTSICSYCDFCKVLYHGPWVTQYINALVDEIRDKYNGDTIRTLYIGGGTPSCLGEKDLRYLLDICKRFNLADDLEFTFECNLNDINDTLLDILKEYGVNRLSIGIESFNENKLKFMERNHSFPLHSAGTAAARRAGRRTSNGCTARRRPDPRPGAWSRCRVFQRPWCRAASCRLHIR